MTAIVPAEAARVSLFVARLLGPLMTIVGVALLTQPDVYRAMLKEFIRSLTLCYLAGFLGLLGGISLVLVHNVWAHDWRLIITLIGWITVARAVLIILWPQWVPALGKRLVQSRWFFTGATVVNLVLGLVLSYFGYMTG